MDVKLLVDDIVRQTTVLIAQLSTAAGVRAPLAHIADQVFVELARELEQQGVRRKVAADMFGLALRSYQLKFQRLAEATVPETSLWQAIHAELARGTRTKDDLCNKLKSAEPADIAAVLQDLVGSGLAYSSGRGSGAVFGLTTDADRQRLTTEARHSALSHLIWQMVATARAATRDELVTLLNVSTSEVDAAIHELLSDGRVELTAGLLTAAHLHIPVGSEHGWEAAISDHFRAVATSIAAKLSRARSHAKDRIGGATLRFTVYPGHPFENDVYALLESTRLRVGALWQQVAAYNEANTPTEHAPCVTFYFGQSVSDGEVSVGGEHETLDLSVLGAGGFS